MPVYPIFVRRDSCIDGGLAASRGSVAHYSINTDGPAVAIHREQGPPGVPLARGPALLAVHTHLQCLIEWEAALTLRFDELNFLKNFWARVEVCRSASQSTHSNIIVLVALCAAGYYVFPAEIHVNFHQCDVVFVTIFTEVSEQNDFLVIFLNF